MATDWAKERKDVLDRMLRALAKVTGDGSKKRQAGTKPPWYNDPEHEAAIFSHLMKWKKGVLVDESSGTHPLVHAAWRCLAIALKEMGDVPRDSTRVRIEELKRLVESLDEPEISQRESGGPTCICAVGSHDAPHVHCPLHGNPDFPGHRMDQVCPVCVGYPWAYDAEDMADRVRRSGAEL